MSKNEKPSTSSVSSAQTDSMAQPAAMRQAQDATPTPIDLSQGIDRPGFDLSGSSDETHAGTGLGLGEDAFDTPGDRRLPGRRLGNDLTIPRWGGPVPRDHVTSDTKTAGPKTASTPKTK